MTLSIIPIEGIGEIGPGDELAVYIADAARAQGTPLHNADCLVITQKVVSKAEHRLVPLDPDDLAARRALVESESVRIVRRRGDLIISETRQGFVCANAGIDLSNVAHGWAALLPVDSDRSAKHVRDALRARAHVEVAVIVSDTFGRPWRRGLTDVAIGVSGIAAVVDLPADPTRCVRFDVHAVYLGHAGTEQRCPAGLVGHTEAVQIEPTGKYVMAYSDGGYTTNVPLDEMTKGQAFVAYQFDDKPLEPVHGGPARLVVPHLYFWKSAKWIRGLRFMEENEPGFWEQLGYHIHGDPWKEERYSGD